MDETTDIEFRHLDHIASDARRAVDTEIITGSAAKSVTNAVAEFDALCESASEHGVDAHSQDLMVSLPTLAFHWMEYAAALWAENAPDS